MKIWHNKIQKGVIVTKKVES